MNVSPEQQKALLALADTDEEIRLLEHKRANLEEQKVLDQHTEVQETVIDELAEASRTKDNLTVQSTRHEREIETVDASRKNSEASMYSGKVTSERELAAIREEVRSMQRRKSDLEDSLLEIMEQLEEVSSLVDDLTTRRSELKDQVTDLTRTRDEAASDIDATLAEVRARRAEQVAGLDDAVVATYDGLRAKRANRRVVAQLQGRTCTGCHMELTAIELEEIKSAARTGLAYCQQCGSIVVLP